MMAWQVATPEPIRRGPLQRRRVPRPALAAGELLLRVLACGVCRTDLHLAEGDLPVHRAGVIPGHEIVGEVCELGSHIDAFKVGDRVGV
ncbi:MAG: alcohol dehydrogenase catalytic domain-containing protein, partial [Mycobacteriaceae bacterium]